MVEISDLTLNIPTSFTIKTKILGELEFLYPTLKHINNFSKFVNCKKNAKECFLELIKSLLIKSKLSKDDLSKLTDQQLKKIGIILLNSQGLQGKFKSIARKRKYGNFYNKFKILYKEYLKPFERPHLLERTLERFPLGAFQQIQNHINQLGVANQIATFTQANYRKINTSYYYDTLLKNASTYDFIQDIFRASEVSQQLDIQERINLIESANNYINNRAQYSIMVSDISNALNNYGSLNQILRNLDQDPSLLKAVEQSQGLIPKWFDDISLFVEDSIKIEAIRDELGEEKVNDADEIIRKARENSFDIKEINTSDVETNRKILKAILTLMSISPLVAICLTTGPNPTILAAIIAQLATLFLILNK